MRGRNHRAFKVHWSGQWYEMKGPGNRRGKARVTITGRFLKRLPKLEDKHRVARGWAVDTLAYGKVRIVSGSCRLKMKYTLDQGHHEVHPDL